MYICKEGTGKKGFLLTQSDTTKRDLLPPFQLKQALCKKPTSATSSTGK